MKYLNVDLYQYNILVHFHILLIQLTIENFEIVLRKQFLIFQYYKSLPEKEFAASHGIRWAGEKDKPHFEFDEKYNGPQPYTRATANKIEKDKTSSIPKDGSILKTDYIDKKQNEENKNDLKISGKPISY